MALSFETDAQPHRARLGLVVLQADETLETEVRGLIDLDGIALYHSRIASPARVTAAGLREMLDRLPAAVDLLPAGPALDAIGYACTSASTVIGEAAVAAAIARARPGLPSTNPLTALKAALRALRVQRLAFVTPYSADLSQAMRERIEQAGVRIAGFGSFEQEEETVVARIAPASILAAVRKITAAAPCDAVFIACTNLRAAGIIAEAEAGLDMPVLTSNQVLCWHLLRLAGIEGRQGGTGRLFDCSLVEP